MYTCSCSCGKVEALLSCCRGSRLSSRPGANRYLPVVFPVVCRLDPGIPGRVGRSPGGKVVKKFSP